MSENQVNNEIDEKLLKRMKVKILQMEQENLATGINTNDAMVDLIKRTIVDTVKKSF